jgi:hypothetical protein
MTVAELLNLKKGDVVFSILEGDKYTDTVVSVIPEGNVYIFNALKVENCGCQPIVEDFDSYELAWLNEDDRDAWFSKDRDTDCKDSLPLEENLVRLLEVYSPTEIRNMLTALNV